MQIDPAKTAATLKTQVDTLTAKQAESRVGTRQEFERSSGLYDAKVNQQAGAGSVQDGTGPGDSAIAGPASPSAPGDCPAPLLSRDRS